jgi:hypothetical protein
MNEEKVIDAYIKAVETKINKLQKENEEMLNWIKLVKECNACSMFPTIKYLDFLEYYKGLK